MEQQVLIVVLDAECPTAELAERIERIRNMDGVLVASTIERVVDDAVAAAATKRS